MTLTDSENSSVTTTESPVAIARRLAAAHPRVTLSCPLCASSLKATNLASHLSKVHPGPLPRHSGPLRIPGVDKRSSYVFLGLLIAWGIAATVAIVLNGPHLESGIGVIGGSALLLLALLAAASLGAFKAHLELDDGQLRLRWLFGLASRTVGFPVALESGTAMATAMTPPGLTTNDAAGSVVKFGAYLRLSSGGSTITIAAKKSPGVAQRWAPTGWTRGKKRRVWDITVDRTELIGIEYQLAARGLLAFRD